MKSVKVLLLLIGISSAIAKDDDTINVPILGSVIGAVEGAVHSAADVVNEGEQVINRVTLGSTIKKALNRFKELMVDKIQLLGLPRLEPLDIQHIDINIQHEIGNFNGTLDNVKIKHLSTFETRDVNVHGLFAFDVDLNLYFEKLEIFGDYDIDAVVGDLFHVFGKGPFNLILHGVDTYVTLQKLKLSEKSLQFNDISIKVVLQKLTSNFTNLMDGGETEKLFNKVIEDIAPEAVEVLWPEIEPIVAEKMKEEGNYRLSQVTIAELIKLFL